MTNTANGGVQVRLRLVFAQLSAAGIGNVHTSHSYLFCFLINRRPKPPG